MMHGRPLRILHSEAATTFGGQEHRILKEMIAMRDRGHHMEAVCQPGSMLAGRLRAAGFTVHPHPMDGVANYVRALLGLRRMLARGRFDVLNTHSRRDTVIAAAAGRLARVPLIVRTRHLARPVGSRWTYTGLPHKVVAVSEHVAGLLRARGVRSGDVRTVPDGIDPVSRPAHSTLRAELGIAPHALVVGCVAHLRPQKGQALLVAAMARLPHVDAHLVLAGAGSQQAALRARACALGCGGRVHFLGHRADISNVLAGCDIFALPTASEALGTAFIEASAHGLPVVGTRVGGVPEVVAHGQTGLLVPPGDVAALAAALGRLAADPPLRLAMGRAGEARIRGDARFSSAGMAAGMEAAYLAWLAGPGAGRP